MYLNCHTALSLQHGTMLPDKLFDEAGRCGVHKLVLTEINNTASYIEMLRLCIARHPDSPLVRDQAHQLEIALGIEFRNTYQFCYIGIAENNTGFEKLNRFLSHHKREDKDFPEQAPELECVRFIYSYGKRMPDMLRNNEFIGVRVHDLNKLKFDKAYANFKNKYVILHPVSFSCKADFNTHRLLRAIANNTVLSKLPVSQQASPDEIMLPESELRQRFAEFPDLITNTEKFLASCSIDFKLHEDKNRKTLTGSIESDWEFLVTKAWEGFQERYDVANATYRERFQRELNTIKRKNFCAYYLIAYDLIAYAKSQGFDYVGRGSGANSMVAFCLGITHVDPLELDLYFERFLNEERTSPPDFDLDFSWDNRDAIYDYLFQRYGPDHICLLGTHVTYQKRSVLRELGKVFGLPKSEIDAIVDEPARHRHRDHITELIFTYAERIKDLPSAFSIHAGGVLITEKPIYAYTALELPPKGYPVSQFEMHSAEDFGIFKFDILSQRGLGHIKETVQHIKRNRGEDVDVYRFNDFKEDEKVKTLLREGKAMGCFYVESPAMRMLLCKLKCDDYLTLVAASSIIRPGVARSGMMRAYIERFHAVRSGGSYEAIHPLMDELMRETYGVMVYQEDVIKVAHHFAGLTLTEADVLRRGMSGKFRSREEFKRVEDRFFETCRTRGYDEKVIQRVWYEIESFSGYSFAKGHSASYAVESYQSLFLKAHYPLEFMVGVINNFGGFYKTEFYFHEARMNGGNIEAPCINHSNYLTTIEGNAIYIGFVHLKSLETKLAHAIVSERNRHGVYKSLDDFLRRVTIGLEQVRILIRIGAFRFSQRDKQQLLWRAMLHFSEKRSKRIPGDELFETALVDYQLPKLQRNVIEDAFDELELLGFPLCDPFTLVNTTDFGSAIAKELNDHIGQQVSILGYVVTLKNTSTIKGELMQFGTFYDRQGYVFDTVHFPDVTKKYPFRGRGFYFLQGKVVEDFGVYMIEVQCMDKIPFISKRLPDTAHVI